jgi:serine/threonine-protein kinase
MTEVPALEPLQRFGDYQLVRKIAQGGMAEIFLARRIGIAGFEKKLVIKRMIDRLAQSPRFVTMFLD